MLLKFTYVLYILTSSKVAIITQEKKKMWELATDDFMKKACLFA